MFLRMICCQSYEGSPGQRINIGSIQERKKNHIAVPRFNGSDPVVRHIVNRSLFFFCLSLFIIHQILYKPLHISRGCRTAFFHQKISRNAKHGIQRYRAIRDRLPTDKFIDAPCSRNHAKLLFTAESGCNAAGIDVKHARCHRNSSRKSGLLRRFLRHITADICRMA